MTTIRRSLAIVAIALAPCLAAAGAQAQPSRTFVSAASGNDANDCSRATPCRTFQGAHDKTGPDGEITVLDAGSYGALTIGKPVSIVNDGLGEAEITASDGASGITINAPATAHINLRGLTVEGAGFGGGSGIRFNSGFALTVVNCFIHNHAREGIDFFPIGNSTLAVSNTLVADNGGQGIVVRPTGSSAVTASFDHVKMYNNGRVGLLVRGQDSTGAIDVTVSDSFAANNGHGFRLEAGRAAASLMLLRSVAVDNRSHGIVAVGPAAVVGLDASTLRGNGLGWAVADGATLESHGDNTISGNGGGDLPPAAAARH